MRIGCNGRVAYCDPANEPSLAIPRKLGFTHDGTLRQKTRFLDRWSDSMIWGLLGSEYPRAQRPRRKSKSSTLQAGE